MNPDLDSESNAKKERCNTEMCYSGTFWIWQTLNSGQSMK